MRKRLGLGLLALGVVMLVAGAASAIIPWMYGTGFFTEHERAARGGELKGEENLIVLFDLFFGPVIGLALSAGALLMIGLGVGLAAGASGRHSAAAGQVSGYGKLSKASGSSSNVER